MKKSLWLLGPTVASGRDVPKALLDVGFTVWTVTSNPAVRLRPSDFHCAARCAHQPGRRKRCAWNGDPALRAWSVANRGHTFVTILTAQYLLHFNICEISCE